ncbi:hypothetical protein SAY87_020310 [Trapa incisa]|uniref:Protein TIC 40, chloroplastic n=1 Tax=Trapa incisa TaxID=236973 RepID=A0AAN7K3R0_9MYRT|nr:hypothetical protein SAY87_020310 [Trapa incisa]
MSPFPAMAANLQASPHLFAAPSSRDPSRNSSRSTGAVPHSKHNLFFRAFACQSRPESPLILRHSQTPRDRQSAKELFARISSSRGKETTSVGAPTQPVSPPPSSIGSPLFWVGVGVGLSAIFSWAATNLKKYAMQQAFKAMMGGMNTQNSPFNTPSFSSVSPSPFVMPSTPQPPTSSAPSPPPVTVDVPVTKVEHAKFETAPISEIKDEPTVKEEPKKYAFVDISPEETKQDSPFKSSEDVTVTTSTSDAQSATEVYQNGAAPKFDMSAFEGAKSTAKGSSGLSVDALEKMMEDPTVQKMVYPYLPEEMRNPDTFKWMLQNPQYRQQLEEMLTNMGGSNEWDSRMMDSLKNFDLSSPEVKQQFDQIGLTPEEVISKIMANPEVAMAFQNPRVQQAIMDCSQNPLAIAKYQNDKEVMDVFNKISELFPGVTGP